jgi:hypothetical protein
MIKELFTKKELMQKIKELFKDTRSGVSTHISSYCVASTAANPGKFRYLTRVDDGLYRIFKQGDEVHKTKENAPLHPKIEDIPSEYRYLLDQEMRAHAGAFAENRITQGTHYLFLTNPGVG